MINSGNAVNVDIGDGSVAFPATTFTSLNIINESSSNTILLEGASWLQLKNPLKLFK